MGIQGTGVRKPFVIITLEQSQALLMTLVASMLGTSGGTEGLWVQTPPLVEWEGSGLVVPSC